MGCGWAHGIRSELVKFNVSNDTQPSNSLRTIRAVARSKEASEKSSVSHSIGTPNVLRIFSNAVQIESMIPGSTMCSGTWTKELTPELRRPWIKQVIVWPRDCLISAAIWDR